MSNEPKKRVRVPFPTGPTCPGAGAAVVVFAAPSPSTTTTTTAASNKQAKLSHTPSTCPQLILASDHAYSGRLAQQIESVKDLVESCRLLRDGLVEVRLSGGRPEGYGCRVWPIRIGGEGLGFVSDWQSQAPVAVRFAVPFSHVNVDDAGFVDEYFWQSLISPAVAATATATTTKGAGEGVGAGGSIDQPTLREIVLRLHEMLLGPFVTGSSSGSENDGFEAEKLANWKKAEELAYRKNLVHEQFRSMALCKALLAEDGVLLSEWFAPDFLAAFERAQKEPAVWREIIQEVSPGIFCFEMFNHHFCDLLAAEIDNYEASSLPRRRPNTMNNYGLILNEVGMEPIFTTMIDKFIAPIAQALFPNEVVVQGLDHHHTFVVNYKENGGDLHLDMHHDASEITVNLCLGKSFKGSGLKFCGNAGAPNHRKLQFTYEHVKGKMILHLGRLRHGADTILEGERLNLILWARSSAFRAAAAFGVVPPDGFPKLPEQGDPDLCCLSKFNDPDYSAMLLKLSPSSN